MTTVPALLLTLMAASQLWAEPPLARVYPDTAPDTAVEAETRLYAARGEYESFQLCIRAGRKGWENVRVTSGPLNESIGAPEVRRLGYVRSPNASGLVGTWPDPLLPMRAFDIPSGETRVLWVTYYVPPSCPAGLHHGGIVVERANGRSWTFRVTVEVFDFELPSPPRASGYFELDREAVTERYDIRSDNIVEWAPHYDALSGYRLSYGLWTGGRMVDVRNQIDVDTETFKRHLAYAVNRGNMAAINLGRSRSGIVPFPLPRHPAAQDSLDTYLSDMRGWLDSQGWWERAFFQPTPLLPPERWNQMTSIYERAHRADETLNLLLEAPLHPYFEGQVDIWAVPLDEYEPEAHKAVAEGKPMAVPLGAGAKAVTASSSGAPAESILRGTRPGDAYDGSVYTAWWSADAPSSRRPEWLQITFAEPVRTDRFRVGWVRGQEPAEIVVRTSFDGRIYARSRVSWEHHMAYDAYDSSWSECVLPLEKRLAGIRLEFRGTINGGPVAVTECEFVSPREASGLSAPKSEVWLMEPTEGFPELTAGSPLIGARMVGWVVWKHQAAGFRGGVLNPWPEEWRRGDVEGRDIWSAQEPVEAWFYPGGETVMPSVRVSLFRDGMEDYEYLAALADRREVVELDDDLASAIRPRLIPPTIRREVIQDYGNRVPDWRVRIGRFLSATAPVAKDGETEKEDE